MKHSSDGNTFHKIGFKTLELYKQLQNKNNDDNNKAVIN